MPEHGSNHTRYSSNCFEEQDSCQPGLFSENVALFFELLSGHIMITGKWLVLVSSNEIKDPSNSRYSAQYRQTGQRTNLDRWTRL